MKEIIRTAALCSVPVNWHRLPEVIQCGTPQAYHLAPEGMR
jgi:hypothetical protein